MYFTKSYWDDRNPFFSVAAVTSKHIGDARSDKCKLYLWLRLKLDILIWKVVLKIPTLFHRYHNISSVVLPTALI